MYVNELHSYSTCNHVHCVSHILIFYMAVASHARKMLLMTFIQAHIPRDTAVYSFSFCIHGYMLAQLPIHTH